MPFTVSLQNSTFLYPSICSFYHPSFVHRFESWIVSIFLGVTYPLIIEAINGEKVSIGPPYYNTIFTPLILITAIFIMASVDSLWQRSKPLKSYVYKTFFPVILISLSLSNKKIFIAQLYSSYLLYLIILQKGLPPISCPFSPKKNGFITKMI